MIHNVCGSRVFWDGAQEGAFNSWVGGLRVIILPRARSAIGSQRLFLRTWCRGGLPERDKTAEGRLDFAGGFFMRTARWRRVVELVVELKDMTETGRADGVGLYNLSVGICAGGSLRFDFPKPKSLLKNPRFSTFRYANNGVRVTAAVGEIFTGGGCLTFSNDEGSGVCPDNKPGILVVEAEATDG